MNDTDVARELTVKLRPRGRSIPGRFESTWELSIRSRSIRRRTMKIPLHLFDPSDGGTHHGHVAAYLFQDQTLLASTYRPMSFVISRYHSLHRTEITVVSDNRELERFLLEESATLHSISSPPPPRDIIVVAASNSNKATIDWPALLERVNRGGRLIVLGRSPGKMPGLPEVVTPSHTTDYLFAAEGLHLPDITDPNGLAPALRFALENDDSKDRTLMYGYPDSSGRPVTAISSRKHGDGVIVSCQVELAGRLAADSDHRDPFCRDLLIRLIHDR
jgi:hypothetical protein